MATGDDVDRTVAGTVLVALGLILAAFSVWQFLTSEIASLVSLLLGVVPGVLLAALLGAVGVWFLRRGPSGGHTRRLLAWAVASATFGALSATLFIIYETNRGAVIYEASLVVVNTAAGFAVFGLLVGRYDVQARQRAGELARYKQLVENIPVGIFRTTPGPDGEFVEVNPAMVELFGAESQSELLDRPVSDVYFDAEDRRDFSAEILEEGLAVEREHRYQRFDGEVFWASVTAIRYDVDGETYFDGILEDITDRKRYERRLERDNRQLEILNDVLRHDVRNDMAVIRSRGERLRSLVDDHDEDFEALLTRVDHVVELTKTARDLATVVTADRDQDLKPVGLAATVRQEIDAIRQAHDDVTVTVDGDLPTVSVRANDMLSSVFRNLLTNAVRHNDTDHPHIVVGVTAGEDTAAVHVGDNGPGVPDDQKEDIFEHGQKGDDSGGTGLGLYLVDALVDQYGGHVDVYDRVDHALPTFGPDDDERGAVFSVTLPLADADGATSWYD